MTQATRKEKQETGNRIKRLPVFWQGLPLKAEL